MKIVVLNLDRSTDRMENMHVQMQRLNLKYSRFSAVDGKELKKEVIASQASLICKNLLCNKSIIGCALSHKQIVQDFISSGEDFICIMEDDIELLDSFPKFLEQIPNFYKKLSFDVVSLFCLGVCESFQTEIVDGYIFSKPVFPLSMACYVLSRKGAMKYLNLFTEKIHYHIDFQLALSSVGKNLDYYVLQQPRVVVVSCNEHSTIGTNKRRSILFQILQKLHCDKTIWFLNIPVLTIRLHFVLTLYTLLLVLLLAISLFRKWHLIFIFLICLEIFLIF